mgnify:CR=1 FL=1
MIFISKEKNNVTDTDNCAIDIRSIQADSIYRVNNGYENAFLDCGKAVIPYSLFSEYMKKHGMTINKSKRKKNGWTSDFIVMKYDYKVKAQTIGDKTFKEMSSGELRSYFYTKGAFVPRQRIATRSGEIIKGRIVKDREIIENVKRLLEVLKPIGQITIQCMKTDDGIKYIEINPRFGGGAPMSITAGANSCENLYRLLMGQQLEYNEEYKENLLFLRFDSSIALNENMEKIDG